jgi:hypothetical protein
MWVPNGSLAPLLMARTDADMRWETSKRLPTTTDTNSKAAILNPFGWFKASFESLAGPHNKLKTQKKTSRWFAQQTPSRKHGVRGKAICINSP